MDVKHVLAALEKVAPYVGASFRGKADNAEFARQGQGIVTRGLVPTSLDLRVATNNFSLSSAYLILGSQGRLIRSFSQFPEEEEVVFLPGEFFVLQGERKVGSTHFWLVENRKLDAQPSHFDSNFADELFDNMRPHIDELRALGKVAASEPEKFCGDID